MITNDVFGVSVLEVRQAQEQEIARRLLANRWEREALQGRTTLMDRVLTMFRRERHVVCTAAHSC